MTYKEQLNPWTVQQQLPDVERRILARFRRRVDADSYLNAMQQMRPGSSFSVVFAVEPPSET